MSHNSLLVFFYSLTGMLLPLLSAVKMLFSHVLDVLSNVQSFQSEYGIMLRHLLAVRGYRFHMRKRIYCSEYQFLSPSETVPVNHCFTDLILYYFFIIWFGKTCCYYSWRRWNRAWVTKIIVNIIIKRRFFAISLLFSRFLKILPEIFRKLSGMT